MHAAEKCGCTRKHNGRKDQDGTDVTKTEPNRPACPAVSWTYVTFQLTRSFMLLAACALVLAFLCFQAPVPVLILTSVAKGGRSGSVFK